MRNVFDRLKAVWDRDNTLIVIGASMLLGPSLLQGRGRPNKIMRLIQFGGLGILGYVAWKNKSELGF